MITSSVERSWRRRFRLEEAVAPPLDPALVVDPEGIWADDAGDGGAAIAACHRCFWAWIVDHSRRGPGRPLSPFSLFYRFLSAQTLASNPKVRHSRAVGAPRALNHRKKMIPYPWIGPLIPRRSTPLCLDALFPLRADVAAGSWLDIIFLIYSNDARTRA